VNDGDSDSGEPRFGTAFRVIVGGAALLSGVILWLWASGLGAAWKYIPALFCLAVFGVVALPRPIAIACGYFVAVTVLALCVWFLYLGVTGKESLWNALRMSAWYGLPALAFLIYRQLPWRSRSDT
jgi:hypothetical protein